MLPSRLGQLAHAHANTHVCVTHDDEEMAKIKLPLFACWTRYTPCYTHPHTITHVLLLLSPFQDDEEMAKILRKGAKALLDGEDDDEDSDDEFTDDEEVRGTRCLDTNSCTGHNCTWYLVGVVSLSLGAKRRK